ncbi:MAG: prenyltransferase/squalene oxidase repeat-containing protein [Myxococcota bacterium]
MSIVTLDTGGGSGDGNGADDAVFIEDLRHRAADALERAYRFLETQPDDWALLRAQVLCQARPASDLGEKLGEVARPDGSLPLGTLISGGAVGFPQLDPGALDEHLRSVLGTLEAMLIAGDARALTARWVEPAVRFLESHQSEDGGYRIPVSNDPAQQAEADVFFTGMISGILGRTPVSKTAPLEAAGAFLAERFSPDAVEHDGYPALLAYSHYYTNVPDEEADEALQWCGRALEKGFRSRRHDAVSTLRVLLTCDAQAMPGAKFDVVEMLERLMEEQAGDGGFAELSFDGPQTRTTQTVDAMIAIVRLCAVLDVDPG